METQESIAAIGTRWYFDSLWRMGGKAPAPDDCLCFNKALLVCCNGDGELSEIERRWVLGHAAAHGVTPAQYEELRNYKAKDDIEEVLKGNHVANNSRPSLVYEAIRACSSDGEFAESERSTVRRMAEVLGIPNAQFEKIEKAIQAEEAAFTQRLQATFPSGHPALQASSAN
jgi:uncharacterized tellurite resistance protein B-like protein